MSLLLIDAPSVASLREIQDGYIAASDELTLGMWRSRSPFRKFIEGGARMVGPLL